MALCNFLKTTQDKDNSTCFAPVSHSRLIGESLLQTQYVCSSREQWVNLGDHLKLMLFLISIAYLFDDAFIL